MSDRLYTVDEVCGMFPGVTPEWLKRQCAKRLVPHVRPHATLVLFSEDDVTAIRKMWRQPARKAS